MQIRISETVTVGNKEKWRIAVVFLLKNTVIWGVAKILRDMLYNVWPARVEVIDKGVAIAAIGIIAYWAMPPVARAFMRRDQE